MCARNAVVWPLGADCQGRRADECVAIYGRLLLIRGDKLARVWDESKVNLDPPRCLP